MKFAKRMLLLPEDEYAAMMELFSGGNKLKAEKAQTESRIARILNSPRLSQLEKGKKADMLYKKKRKLNKMIDDRALDDKRQGFNETLPTTGVVPAVAPENNLQQMQEQMQEDLDQTLREPENLDETQEAIEQEPVREGVRDAVREVREVRDVREPERRKFILQDFKDSIAADSIDDLKEYIFQNRLRFGIKINGGILKNKVYTWEDPVSDLSYMDIVDYIGGVRNDFDNKLQKQAAGSLIRRLISDQVTKRFFDKGRFDERQEGEGIRRQELRREERRRQTIRRQSNLGVSTTGESRRRNKNKYIVELKMKRNINRTTPGLHRKKFRPVLWTKIGV